NFLSSSSHLQPGTYNAQHQRMMRSARLQRPWKKSHLWKAETMSRMKRKAGSLPRLRKLLLVGPHPLKLGSEIDTHKARSPRNDGTSSRRRAFIISLLPSL